MILFFISSFDIFVQIEIEQPNTSHTNMLKNLFFATGIFLASGLINTIMATPLPPGPSVVPIDGGVSLLVAACAGYGAKKIYDSRKEKK